MSLVLLTVSLLWAAPTRAQSGYPGSSGWVAKAGDPVVTGTVSGIYTDAQGNPHYLNRPYVNDGSSPPPLGVNAGESLTYKVNGTVTYTWKWNGGPNNLPPPPSQGVRETATAGASGGGDASGTVTATASDGGIGKENKTNSVSADGKTQSHSDGFGGSKLVTMDGSSGTLTVTGTVQAECDLSEPKSSGYPGGGYPGSGGGGYPGSGGSGTLSGSAGGKFTAVLDDRLLALHSFQTWHKDPSTGYHVPDIPDPDGTFEMTSIYSHHLSSIAGDPPSVVTLAPFINWIEFTSNFLGSWHWKSWTNHSGNTALAPDVVDPDTWKWSPDESEDAWDYGKVSMGYGQIDYVNGQAVGQPTGNQTYHVSYTATDNTDQVSATANAKIALHDEWENKQNATPATTGRSQRKYCAPNGAIIGVSNTTSTQFTSPPTWSLTINGSVTLGSKFSPVFDVGWAKLLGIDINASVTVGGAIAITVPGPLLKPGFATYPCVTTTWNTNNYLVDHYTVAGFDAIYPQFADDPNSVRETGGWSDPVKIGISPP